MNIYYVGVADESLPEQNNDDDVTVNDDTVEKNKNENIDDVGVDNDSIPDKNNYDDATVNDDTV